MLLQVQFADGTIGVLFDDGGPFPKGYNAMAGDCKDKVQQIAAQRRSASSQLLLHARQPDAGALRECVQVRHGAHHSTTLTFRVQVSSLSIWNGFHW